MTLKQLLQSTKFHFIFILAVLITACTGSNEPFTETFDEAGDWRVAGDSNVSGEVADGVYNFHVFADNFTFWTTAGLAFQDGMYEVEATQVSGPVDNGYGMIFRVDDKKDDFYSFQISGDGFVWIGRYKNGGKEEIEPIIDEWWFASEAIYQGLNVKNRLGVRAEGANLIFYVNNQEVGRVTDNTFPSGDIGLMVRTLGIGDVNVQFDNFSVTPIE